MELSELAGKMPNLASRPHVDKIKLFAWYIHVYRGRDRFNQADIRACYDQLHLEKPTSVSPYLKALEDKKPKEVMRDTRGFYLERRIRDALEQKYGEIESTEARPATEQVLPLAIIQKTRGYLERIVMQANGCYERRWFDACSVMVRKFVEIMIIEVYEAGGRAAEIKDKSGDFFMLSDLIDTLVRDQSLNLGRETKRVLPLIKQMGDRSAHTRRYIATKLDVDAILPGLRVAAEELLHLAGLK